MKYTNNFRFKKPEPLDTVNIEDINDTFDLLDSELKKQKDNNDTMLVSERGRVYEERERILEEEKRITNEENRVDEFSNIKKDYNGLKTIMLDENNAANLQDQVNKTNSYLSDISVNVKTFGAKGDGVIDDTTAIQNAITYAIDNGHGKVYFPKGIYLISSPIQVTSPIALVGQNKVNTVIQTNTDINMIDLRCRCELSNFTFKINLLTHSKSIIRYFAITGGSKNGIVRDIYIIGLDGYQNATKAIEFAQENGSTGSRSWLMFWTFDNIYVEFCESAWYTEADFTLCWTTACTFKNVIVERCKRAIYFNTNYIPGYYSRYDFIDWQFQCNTVMNRAFEAPSNRSIIDIHVWDRPSFSDTPKSIYIKGLARDNVFRFRNIDNTQIEVEKPSSNIRNTFEVYDDVKYSKNIFLSPILYVDSVNGNDSIADGSQLFPYKTISSLIKQLPLFINEDIVIQLADGIYNETVEFEKYYGGGTITFKGSTSTIINNIIVSNNRVRMEFRNLTIKSNNNRSAILVTDSEFVYFYNVNVVPDSGIVPSTGYYIQATKVLIRDSIINNCTTAILSTAIAQIRIDSVTGSGNITGYKATNGGIINYTVSPSSTLATILYSVSSAGIISAPVGIKQAPSQINSTATDVSTLVLEFNSLLSKLRESGIIAQ